MNNLPIAMTIAGSDSIAGAGVQADLKTFAALGVYGTCVLTAITAQNTQTVSAIHEIPAPIISRQIDAIVSDVKIEAVKIGMLFSPEIIKMVSLKIREAKLDNIVVDPVMIAKSGANLTKPEAVISLKSLLLPLAKIVTPNIPEAQILCGHKIDSEEDIRRSAQEIKELGPKSVVIKGGHLSGPATDLFYDGNKFEEFTSPRISTKNTHGTGCTFSSAIAAQLANRLELSEAVSKAKKYVTASIKHSLSIGHGNGPLDHFHKFH